MPYPDPLPPGKMWFWNELWYHGDGGWQIVDDPNYVPPVAPTVLYPGYVTGMPRTAPAAGYHWESPGYRAGYGHQGWQQVKDGTTRDWAAEQAAGASHSNTYIEPSSFVTQRQQQEGASSTVRDTTRELTGSIVRPPTANADRTPTLRYRTRRRGNRWTQQV